MRGYQAIRLLSRNLSRKLRIIVLLSLICSPCFAGVDFDKVDDKITVAKGGTVDDLATADFTCSAWIKPVDIGENNTGRVATKRNNSGNDSGGGWLFFTDATSSIGAQVIDSGGALENQSRGADNAITLNAWNHVLMEYNATTKIVDLYVDGSEIGYETQTTGTTTGGADSSGDLTIGNIGPLDRTFNGIITENALWTEILTQSEKDLLAKSKVKRMPLQIQPASLVMYLPMNEQPDGTSFDGGIAVDRSGNGHNGTGDDGGNNTGLTAKAEEVISYP